MSGSPHSLNQLGNVVPERSPVGQREVLDVGGAGIGRADEEEHAGAVATARGEERLD